VVKFELFLHSEMDDGIDSIVAQEVVVDQWNRSDGGALAEAIERERSSIASGSSCVSARN
jgi:hypothetical protein